MFEIIFELKEKYDRIKPNIQARVREFKNIWDTGNDETVFSELAFCLFTPQSKAVNCWKTVEILKEKKLLYSGSSETISQYMNLVRFRNNKARYLVKARKEFIINGNIKIKDKIQYYLQKGEAREWLVQNIKGLGYKEASHFLRNIGANSEYAILDRHILKNLLRAGIINKIPKTLTKKKYMEIEKKMQDYSAKIGIPISHLDLLFWYLEAGEIFK